MKKVCSLLLAAAMMMGMMLVLDTPMCRAEDGKLFVVVEDSRDYTVVYCKRTKVMYAVSAGQYNRGNFTLLVNPDGSPMLWVGE